MQLYVHATNNALSTTLQGESIDIDKSLEEVDLAEPYIAAFGVTRDSITDSKLVREKNILESHHCPLHFIVVSRCTSFLTSRIPPHFIPFMLFLEKYVYGMTPKNYPFLFVVYLGKSLSNETAHNHKAQLTPSASTPSDCQRMIHVPLSMVRSRTHTSPSLVHCHMPANGPMESKPKFKWTFVRCGHSLVDAQSTALLKGDNLASAKEDRH